MCQYQRQNMKVESVSFHSRIILYQNTKKLTETRSDHFYQAMLHYQHACYKTEFDRWFAACNKLMQQKVIH